MVLLCELDAVGEVIEYFVEELGLKIVDLHELLAHYCGLSLPRGIFQQSIPELNKTQEFVGHDLVFALILGHPFQILHFGLHVDEVGELLYHFPHVVLEGLQGDHVLHEGMEPRLLLPHLSQPLGLLVCLLHEAVRFQY